MFWHHVPILPTAVTPPAGLWGGPLADSDSQGPPLRQTFLRCSPKCPGLYKNVGWVSSGVRVEKEDAGQALRQVTFSGLLGSWGRGGENWFTVCRGLGRGATSVRGRGSRWATAPSAAGGSCVWPEGEVNQIFLGRDSQGFFRE